MSKNPGARQVTALPPSPRPGDTVNTPSGLPAIVVEVYDGIGEALVQWESGEQAQFRLTQLLTAPPT